MKAIKYIFILSASLFIFSSCSKQVVGPQGTQGVQGNQGPSATFDATIDSIPSKTATAWGSVGNNIFASTISNVTGLTDPNYAIVEVYVSTTFNGSSTWSSVPGSLGTNALTCSYTTGKVTIDYAGATAPTQKIYVKIVVLPQP